MLYKLFVLGRVPISTIAMLCLGMGVSAAAGALGFVVAVGALVFMGVVTGKLANWRPDALQWAAWLLALELLGVALFLFTPPTERDFAYPVVGLFGLLWTLPNGLYLYSLRSKFASAPDVKK